MSRDRPEIGRAVALVLYSLVASRIHPQLPGSRASRVALARVLCADVARNALIHPNVKLTRGLVLRDGAGVGFGTVFTGGNTIDVGRGVRMGPQCLFITGDHVVPRTGESFDVSGHISEPITVGDGAFIGARVTVLPGVSIGAGATVGAGSVVTRDVPARTVVAGAPARPVARPTAPVPEPAAEPAAERGAT